ncbi:MAG: LPXTG cell wall anchor domain-containing protein [Clostridia bacterium]|nr:LPXTG cell wall anchor domain-containing protein [Clostridia bacterium]
MKKTLLSVILFVIVALFATTMVNATTGAELPEAIYNKGSKYGVTQSHKVKMERYVAKHPVTDEQANQVMAKVDEVVAVLEKAGVTNIADLSSADLKKVQDLSTEAAAIVNVKIVWRGSTVDIYYNGKVEDTLSFSKNMTNTGDETNIALVVSSVAVVALAAGLVIRKKIVNA